MPVFDSSAWAAVADLLWHVDLLSAGKARRANRLHKERAMAQPATKQQHPDHLDGRAPTSFYWQLTLLATLGGFLFGYDTSNIGSALNFVPYHLHGLALGYLVSGASLGAAAGAILGGPASDHFGRKVLLVIDAGIYAAGAICPPSLRTPPSCSSRGR